MSSVIAAAAWKSGFRAARDLAAKIASPIHSSMDGEGCMNFCENCKTRRKIRDEILALQSEESHKGTDV